MIELSRYARKRKIRSLLRRGHGAPTDTAHTECICCHNLINGMGDTAFDSSGTTTRGMIVPILYRYEGSPAAGVSNFSDVPAGQYYAGPVASASAHGIANGYPNGTFVPNDPITQEQFAAASP